MYCYFYGSFSAVLTIVAAILDEGLASMNVLVVRVRWLDKVIGKRVEVLDGRVLIGIGAALLYKHMMNGGLKPRRCT